MQSAFSTHDVLAADENLAVILDACTQTDNAARARGITALFQLSRQGNYRKALLRQNAVDAAIRAFLLETDYVLLHRTLRTLYNLLTGAGAPSPI